MEYWNELYKELAEKIKENLPAIEWIDLWHDQVSFLTEELPFPTPAVFIGFTLLNTEDSGELVQQCNVQVDMYLFFETFSDTYAGSYNQDSALKFLQELTKLHALFHGKNGESYSPMRRTGMSREESGGAGNLYRISFECLTTDYSAKALFIEVQNPDAEVELTKGPPDRKPEEGFYDVG